MNSSSSVGTAAESPQAPPSQPEGQQNGPQAAETSSPTATTDPSAKTACAARWAALPAALRDRRQWVVAGANKRPLTGSGLAYASSTNPQTWMAFEDACQIAWENRELVTTHVTKDGETITQTGLDIGYMLHESDPFTCIDLDVKDDTTPEQLARFDSIVQHFDSYTERSRSGKGLHVWVEGKIGKGVKRDGVEVYSQERFIICTGDVVRQMPIAARHDLLDTLVGEMHADEQRVQVKLDGDAIPDFALAARAAEDAGELGRLFRGEWQGRYPSQSEADLALTKLLMSHAESPRECWLTFRLSALGKRDKAGRPDYAQSTLSEAARLLAAEAIQVAHGRQLADAMFWREQLYDPSHFRLLMDDDLLRLPPQRWLVKNIVPAASVGTIFGQSGTFKSFLALDLLAHVANGQPWFGYRVKAAPAVYVPFEGKGGVPKRVAAWCAAKSRQAQCAVTTRMAFITDPMNLRMQADRDKLVTTLTANGWAGGMLCIDTLAQAGAGIDENSSEGMGEMIAIFQELQHRMGGAVLVIHHSGKVQSAGMRGWSGLRGALDFVIECQKPDEAGVLDARFKLDKVKDEEEGKIVPFSMLRVHLGYDEDGDPVNSLTIVPPQERAAAVPPDDAAQAAADDDFVDGWVRKLMDAGQRPTGRGLDALRVTVKAERDLTQKRLRDAIARLKDRGRLVEEPGGPSGAKWLRAIDLPAQEAKQ